MAKSKIWAFNKGEWAEAYVFMKLLGVGRVYGADSELKRNENVFIDIINVLRFQDSKVFKYERSDENVSGFIEDECFYVITAPSLERQADYLFKRIMSTEAGKRKLEDIESQRFLEEIGFTTPKQSSIPKEYQDRFGKKTDIILTSSDSRDKTISQEGYSIKSHLGSCPTLFNAAVSSGLIYEIVGCTEDDMNEINAKDKFTLMLSCIEEKGLEIKFVKARSETFATNVSYTDSMMIHILDALLRLQTGIIPGAKSLSSEDLVDELVNINPLNVPVPKYFYPAKVKQFHFDAFAGMTASVPWDGRKRLTGGYIDVGKDGELLYYRAVSDDVFMSYLHKHLKFDRPDRGVNKEIAVAKAKARIEGRDLSPEELHSIMYDEQGQKKAVKGDWGYIYKDADKYYMVLNFQTRFRK